MNIIKSKWGEVEVRGQGQGVEVKRETWLGESVFGGCVGGEGKSVQQNTTMSMLVIN